MRNVSEALNNPLPDSYQPLRNMISSEADKNQLSLQVPSLAKI